MSSYEIRQGDVLDRLREMPDESVHCVITSPPYLSLRDYGIPPSDWPEVTYQPMAGLPTVTVPPMSCAFGLEPDVTSYIGHLVLIFREVWRVMRPDSSLWLNLGDSYAGGGGYYPDSPSNQIDVAKARGAPGAQMNGSRIKSRENRNIPNLKPKDLMMVPARAALALQAEGFWLRSDITWAKKSPMPESVRDRPTSATEKIYLLTRSDRYFYDADAVREITGREADPEWYEARKARVKGWTGDDATGKMARQDATARRGDNNNFNHPLGRNLWNYWLLSPDAFAEAHFATFPKEIPRRAILAGTSERGVCGACGAPWCRVTEQEYVGERNTSAGSNGQQEHKPGASHDLYAIPKQTTGWVATCPCDAPTVPATVLDCFSGAGTTGVVATQLGRRYIGIELNQEYIDMSLKRIHNQGAPLFSWADGQGQAQQDPNSQAVGSR